MLLIVKVGSLRREIDKIKYLQICTFNRIKRTVNPLELYKWCNAEPYWIIYNEMQTVKNTYIAKLLIASTKSLMLVQCGRGPVSQLRPILTLIAHRGRVHWVQQENCQYWKINPANLDILPCRRCDFKSDSYPFVINVLLHETGDLISIVVLKFISQFFLILDPIKLSSLGRTSYKVVSQCAHVSSPAHRFCPDSAHGAMAGIWSVPGWEREHQVCPASVNTRQPHHGHHHCGHWHQQGLQQVSTCNNRGLWGKKWWQQIFKEFNEYSCNVFLKRFYFLEKLQVFRICQWVCQPQMQDWSDVVHFLLNRVQSIYFLAAKEQL